MPGVCSAALRPFGSCLCRMGCWLTSSWAAWCCCTPAALSPAVLWYLSTPAHLFRGMRCSGKSMCKERLPSWWFLAHMYRQKKFMHFIAFLKSCWVSVVDSFSVSTGPVSCLQSQMNYRMCLFLFIFFLKWAWLSWPLIPPAQVSFCLAPVSFRTVIICFLISPFIMNNLGKCFALSGSQPFIFVMSIWMKNYLGVKRFTIAGLQAVAQPVNYT